MGTYHRANLGFPNGHASSAGHTGKSRPGRHPGNHCWSQCHQLPLCIDPTLSSATACMGCFECCTKCILGWKSNFSRQIRHTRTHINYRFWALIHEDRCRNHKFTAASRVQWWQARISACPIPGYKTFCVWATRAKQHKITNIHMWVLLRTSLWGKLCWLLPTNLSPGLPHSLHLLHIFLYLNK